MVKGQGNSAVKFQGKGAGIFTERELGGNDLSMDEGWGIGEYGGNDVMNNMTQLKSFSPWLEQGVEGTIKKTKATKSGAHPSYLLTGFGGPQTPYTNRSGGTPSDFEQEDPSYSHYPQSNHKPQDQPLSHPPTSSHTSSYTSSQTSSHPSLPQPPSQPPSNTTNTFWMGRFPDSLPRVTNQKRVTASPGTFDFNPPPAYLCSGGLNSRKDEARGSSPMRQQPLWSPQLRVPPQQSEESSDVQQHDFSEGHRMHRGKLGGGQGGKTEITMATQRGEITHGGHPQQGVDDSLSSIDAQSQGSSGDEVERWDEGVRLEFDNMMEDVDLATPLPATTPTRDTNDVHETLLDTMNETENQKTVVKKFRRPTTQEEDIKQDTTVHVMTEGRSDTPNQEGCNDTTPQSPNANPTTSASSSFSRLTPSRPTSTSTSTSLTSTPHHNLTAPSAQDTSTSSINISTSSSTSSSILVRPMPDMSAFDCGLSTSSTGRTRVRKDDVDKGGIESPMICPPTPVRTPGVKEWKVIPEDGGTKEGGLRVRIPQWGTREDRDFAKKKVVALHKGGSNTASKKGGQEVWDDYDDEDEEDDMTFLTHFSKIGDLGMGTQSDVFKVRDRKGKVWAVKRNKKQFRGKKERKVVLREVEMMQHLQETDGLGSAKGEGKSCEFLLLFVKAWQEDKYFYSQTELCSRGNLNMFKEGMGAGWKR